jgi:YjbE family integral membrane protein
MSVGSPDFWLALMQIIGVNIVLSGDNAVVIALAARGLPAAQQKKAVAWGSGAAVVMRIVLTIVAVELLRLPYLKLIGAVLLIWIAVKLLIPESEGEGHGAGNTSMAAAIKTILLADLVMSLDNVIAVAAAAKGSVTLLVVGLAISIPLVVFASQILLKLIDRYPFIVTLGAALLGWVAGEMAIGDPVVKDWVDTNAAFLHYVAPAAAAAGVVLLGSFLARRASTQHAAAAAAAMAITPALAPRIHAAGRVDTLLLPVDGSEGALAAVRQAIGIRAAHAQPSSVVMHLINVQRALPTDAAQFVAAGAVQEFHRERAESAFAPARALLEAAGITAQTHLAVGEPGRVIAETARSLDCDQIVMGARGLGTFTGGLLGSVTHDTLVHAMVPVLVVKPDVSRG